MAVVQISRIQIRRGQAGQGTGLPQLASGEMAWAVDTQQLFIGNGSVSEGAPAVGNTRVLTINDLTSYSGLLSSLQYTYQSNNATIQTGPSANLPTVRTFQQRLDDRINTTDFGTVGDGVTDDTSALQRAIDQLFLNPSQPASTYSGSGEFASGTVDAVSRRDILEIPAGIYYITNTLYIPSYTTLVGAGSDKTIFYFQPSTAYAAGTTLNSNIVTLASARNNMVGATITGTGIPANTTIVSVVVGVSVTISSVATVTSTSPTSASLTIAITGPAIQFVNDLSTIGNPSPITATIASQQPRFILMKGITVHSVSGANTCLQLDSVKDCVFENLLLQGDWNNTYNAKCIGINLNSTSSLVTCEGNIFKNIIFKSLSYAVFAISDILNNIFEDCYITSSRTGISLGQGSNSNVVGQLYGPSQTQIINCKFLNIKQHAVYVERGTGNITSNSKLVNVGNNGASNTSAVYPQIYFTTFGNSSSNDFSDRAYGTNGQDGLLSYNYTTPYVPELGGHGTYKSFGSYSLPLAYKASYNQLFRLPVSTDYVGNPTGAINYTIDYFYQSNHGFNRRGTISISANITTGQLQLSDEFDFAGTESIISGNVTSATVLDFNATFLDQTGATYSGTAGQIPSSISINYINSYTSDSGNLDFSFTYSQ